MKTMIVVIALTIAAPAVAQNIGPVLWQNINAGMTPAQIHTLYPQGQERKGVWVVRDLDVLNGCKATADIHYENGTVTKVILFGKKKLFASLDSCPDRLRDAVLTKYGEPVNAKNDASLAMTMNGLESQGFMWSRDGIMVRFHHSEWTTGAPWTMEYDATAQASKL